MNKIEKQKKYMQDIYCKYWISAREKNYKDLPYDRYLMNLIDSKNIVGAVLEIAIGTGIPFGKYFYKKCTDFTGIDISPLLIEECKRLNPGINVFVEDAENLKFQDKSFNLTYCFHSSWYFPDLQKAISEMLRVTKLNGFIIFDIINSTNPEIKKQNDKSIYRENSKIYLFIHILKKIVKIFLGIPDSWRYVRECTPSDPIQIISMLKSSSFYIFGRASDDRLIQLSDYNEFQKYSRLVFLIEK